MPEASIAAVIRSSSLSTWSCSLKQGSTIVATGAGSTGRGARPIGSVAGSGPGAGSQPWPEGGRGAGEAVIGGEGTRPGGCSYPR